MRLNPHLFGKYTPTDKPSPKRKPRLHLKSWLHDYWHYIVVALLIVFAVYMASNLTWGDSREIESQYYECDDCGWTGNETELFHDSYITYEMVGVDSEGKPIYNFVTHTRNICPECNSRDVDFITIYKEEPDVNN